MTADDTFRPHRLNAEGFIKADQIAEIFENALTELETLCAFSPREMALVKTKLQEACFFAKRAIAILPENQEK